MNLVLLSSLLTFDLQVANKTPATNKGNFNVTFKKIIKNFEI